MPSRSVSQSCSPTGPMTTSSILLAVARMMSCSKFMAMIRSMVFIDTSASFAMYAFVNLARSFTSRIYSHQFCRSMPRVGMPPQLLRNRAHDRHLKYGFVDGSCLTFIDRPHFVYIFWGSRPKIMGGFLPAYLCRIQSFRAVFFAHEMIGYNQIGNTYHSLKALWGDSLALGAPQCNTYKIAIITNYQLFLPFVLLF